MKVLNAMRNCQLMKGFKDSTNVGLIRYLAPWGP